MIKRIKIHLAKKIYLYIELIADIFAIFISYSLHFYLRFYSDVFATTLYPTFLDFLITGFIILIYWLIIFFFAGLYRNWYVQSPFDEFFAIIKTSLIGNLILFFLIIIDDSNRPRLLFLLYFIHFTFFVLIFRFIVRRIQRYLRINGLIEIPILVVGTTNKIQELIAKIRSSPAWGYKPVAGIILDYENVDEEYKKSINMPLFTLSEFDNVIEMFELCEIIISTNTSDPNLLLEIASKASAKNITVKIVPDLYEVLTGLVRTLPLYSMPFIEINPVLLRPWEAFLKRTMDIVVSLIVLTVGFPLWLLVALLIKLDSPGPIFYKQERVGKNGKIFILYKFRSMYKDAEKEGPKVTIINDPRVTRVGYLIRRTHIDEIPQFWNVLKGEMSLVGPRPERPMFFEKYSKEIPFFYRRLSVRPGMTGLNQVNSPLFEINTEIIKSKLQDDLYYIENMSLKLDIEILIRTFLLVVKGKGQA